MKKSPITTRGKQYSLRINTREMKGIVQMKITYATLLAVFGLILIGCDPEESEELHPLAGTYTLAKLTIETQAYSNIDTMAILTNYGDTIPVSIGDLVSDLTTEYVVADGINGTVVLNNDGTASLVGALPVNIGSDCDPQIFLMSVASDGEWEVDLTSGAFDLNLTYDLLDIHGEFDFDEALQEMEISYTTVDSLDTLGITSLLVNNQDQSIYKLCIPVITNTERTMEFTKE